MTSVGAAFKFGMELAADVERVVLALHRLHNIAVGRYTSNNKSRFFKRLLVVVVKLISVAVALTNSVFTVSRVFP